MRHYDFGIGKWVFVDWQGIDPGHGTPWTGEPSAGFCVPRGVELKAHSPNIDSDFCIPLDRPWESGGAAYATFLEDQGVFRCWYEHDGGVGYAESDDGVTWRKPELGLHEFNGSTANNLLDFYGHGACVFIDLTAPPAERYKMVRCLWTEDQRAVLGAVSPDGLHWTPLPEPVLQPQHADTQSICLYDEALGQYVLYTRQTDGVMLRRGINRAVSDDFHRFQPSVPIMEIDPLDPPDWDVYCSGYSRWPGTSAAHVMRLSMYKHTAGLVDVHLALSRDGVMWHRPQGRSPWISGGPSHPNPYSSVYACAGILPSGRGEWSTYVGALPLAHHEPNERMARPAGILHAAMREDGFMSLTSTGPGEFWTIPFRLQSDTIRLNVRTAYSGFARAELLDSSSGETGSESSDAATFGAIEGYALDDCVPITGDHTDAAITWKGGALQTLIGRMVRLHVDLSKADLYAIKFS